MEREAEIQIELCKYIKYQYPKALFNSDLAGWLPVGMNIKAKQLRSCNGWLDLRIVEPGYLWFGRCFTASGRTELNIELKKERTKLKTKKGEWYKGDSLAAEVKMIKALNKRSIAACFCVGMDAARELVDAWLTSKGKIVLLNDYTCNIIDSDTHCY